MAGQRTLFGESAPAAGYRDADAVVSACGQYRYHLWRIWDAGLPVMVFVMQNPSTADATDDDPTIRRCVGFAKRDGFGGISVRNVFALRATDEREILTHPDPFGPENESHLLAARSVSLMTKLVVAWGNRLGKKKSRHSDAYKQAACACSVAYCLGVTKGGDPRHPLFVRADAPLVPWTAPAY